MKPGRDAIEVSSYHPISLQPTETKIIGKILANRLKAFKRTIVHPNPNQTGFMAGRHMFFNLHRQYDILYAEHTSDAVIISLDAQYAFDQGSALYALHFGRICRLSLVQKMHRDYLLAPCCFCHDQLKRLLPISDKTWNKTGLPSVPESFLQL